MSGSLSIKNQQRAFPINVRLLRRLTLELLCDLLSIKDYDLGIYIVRAPKMAEINQTFLQHKGSTDVITFDYGLGVPPSGDPESRADTERQPLHGELFICIDDAIAQARQFRTTWQSELTRYVIHGILHLRGYDDLKPAARRIMKREENRLLRQISGRVSLRRLSGKASAT